MKTLDKLKKKKEMKMNNKIAVLLVAVVTALSSGCSELLSKTEGFSLLPKNSLVVLDQKNQMVRAYGIDKSTNIILDTVATTTINDVKIQGDFAYVVVSVGDRLVRYDLKTGSSSVLGFAAGSNPYYQVIDGNRIYVTLWVSNQVAVVDRDSFSLIGTIPLPSPGEPCGITADTDRIYVAASGGYMTGYADSRITVIAKSNCSVVTNIPVWKNPQAMTIIGDKMYLACASDYMSQGKVQRINLKNWSVSNINAVTAYTPVYIRSCSNRIFVADGFTGGLHVYSLLTKRQDILLTGVYLQGMDFTAGSLYTTEGWAGTRTYRVNLTDLSVETINGIGGGDCALYQ